MSKQIRISLRRARFALVLGTMTFALAGGVLLASASAQETPEASPGATPEATGTPGAATGTVVRIEVDPQPEPIESGDVFNARIVVDNVEHLAGFDFTVQFNPDKLALVDAGDSDGTPASTPISGEPSVVVVDQQGEFLATSERGNGGDGVACTNAVVQSGQIKFGCSTLGSPLCLGGPAGASGSGILAVVPFESRGGGITTLDLVDSLLVSDDVQPCDPDDPDFQPIAIEHTRQGTSIELAEKSDSNTTLIVVIVIVVVAVLAAGGAGGYWWYRQRSATA